MNNKGFTLIELLAVIVILAVIALITVPAVMNVVSDAKQSAFKDSAYGLIKTADAEYVQDTFTDNTIDKFFLFTNGVMTSYPSGSTLDYKGSTPLDGGLVLHSDGTVTMAIHDGAYCAVKTRYVSEVTISNINKTNCNNEILYSQASAPYSNLITNGDFSNGTTGWGWYGASLSVVSGRLAITPTVVWGNGHQNVNMIMNNIYYISAEVDGTVANFFGIANLSIDSYKYVTGTGVKRLSVFATKNTSGVQPIQMGDNRISGWTTYYLDNVMAINLTTVFGSGNEPTVAEMDHNLNKVWIDTANSNTPKRFTAGGWISF